jgi:hypothetical protein
VPAFDDEAGSIAYVDAGLPGRIDFGKTPPAPGEDRLAASRRGMVEPGINAGVVGRYGPSGP